MVTDRTHNKIDSLSLRYLSSFLRNRFVSPLWIGQTSATRAFPTSSPFFSLLPPLPTAAKRKATTEQLGARAESNGYKRGALREKDSTRDNGKHNKKSRSQPLLLLLLLFMSHASRWSAILPVGQSRPRDVIRLRSLSDRFVFARF